MQTTTADPAASTTTTSTHAAAEPAAGDTGTPQLRRPVQDRMLAGVASGIARYLGADVTAVRIILAVLAVLGGAGVPIYLAGWLLIPEEGSEQSIAAQLIESLQTRSR
jgi:phage shock protein C